MNAILNAAWGVRGLSGTEKVVLVRLADRADGDGLCFPGQTGLAADCCLTVRAIQNALKSLVEKGHLAIVKPATFSTPATYRVAPAPPEPGSSPLLNDVRTNPQLTLIEPTITKAPASPAHAADSKGTRKPRERDPIFDALAAAEGSSPAELTKRAAQAIGVAAAEIRKATPTVTPDEVDRRAANYHRVMPKGATLTAYALAKHWAHCCDSAGSPKAPMGHAERLRRAIG